MEIQSFKKIAPNRYKVTIKDHEEVILYDDIILKYKLLVNKNITTRNLTIILNENKVLEAYYDALKFISQKMRAKKEVVERLKEHECSQKTIDSLIKKLYDEGYLNDERYIKAFITDQINLKKVGPKRIYQELLKLNFDEEKVNDAIFKIEDSVWEIKARKLIEKKIKSNTKYSVKFLKEKIVGELYNLGYDRQMVRELLEEYEITNDPKTTLKQYQAIYKTYSKRFSGAELEYYIKSRMASKGFSSEDINNALKSK